MKRKSNQKRFFHSPSFRLRNLPPVKTMLLLILIIIFVIAELIFGTVSISPEQIWAALNGGTLDNESTRIIILESRLPRALTAILAGSSIAMGGMLMQTLFRNPLAGPSVLGVSSGASLGVAILVMAGTSIGSRSFVPGAIAMAAITGALLVLLIIILVAGRLRDNTTLLIFGIMLSFFTGAIVDALQFSTGNESLRVYITWGMGSFASTSMTEILWMLLALATGIIITVPVLRKMDIFLLGDTYAASMGVNTRRTGLLMIAASGILAGTATAWCGPVAFIGLAVPHIIRSWYGTLIHRRIWIPVLLLGAVLAMLCDLVSLLLNLPLNTVASALGAPVVIWIIFRGSKSKAII